MLVRNYHSLLTILICCLLLASCSQDDISDIVVPQQEEKDKSQEKGEEAENDEGEDTSDEDESPESVLGSPYFTEELVWPAYPELTNKNFVYPTRDPFGKPIMLSATITMGREIGPDTPLRGFVLYNHYTICRWNDCPNEGMLDMQHLLNALLPGSGFAIVSADYYGFGQTADSMQAYCLGSANARASIDALLAARRLVADEGYTWEDDLLNIGYSQGAQTSIAVLRLATEEYPDLHFTRTMAGGGPYDLEETYRQYLTAGTAELPSAVISILMACNKYYRLGIARESMFKGRALDHLDEWVLSKQYSALEIDSKIGSHDITTFIAPPLLDLSSSVSKAMMAALAKENLCQGWTPRKDEDIMLLHNKSDEIAPEVNTTRLYDFFKAQGLENVELQKADYFSLGLSEHVGGAAMFLAIVGKWMREHYLK